jgi:hypothetical protein
MKQGERDRASSVACLESALLISYRSSDDGWHRATATSVLTKPIEADDAQLTGVKTAGTGAHRPVPSGSCLDQDR